MVKVGCIFITASMTTRALPCPSLKWLCSLGGDKKKSAVKEIFDYLFSFPIRGEKKKIVRLIARLFPYYF